MKIQDNTYKIDWIPNCLFLCLLAAPAVPALAQYGILGTWELIDISGLTIADVPPHGVPAVKYYFRADGRLFILGADEILERHTLSVPYRFANAILVFDPPPRGLREVPVQFPDNQHLVLIFGDRERWTLRRIDGDNAHDRMIEPRSVAVLQAALGQQQRSALDVGYDENDYSNLPLNERLVGIWEAHGYYDIPPSEAPTVGFRNLKHVFTPDGLAFVLAPDVTSTAGQSYAHYQTRGDDLILILSDDRRLRYRMSFNSWGHLLLASPGATQSLKLISREISDIPILPEKVCLLELR